MEEIITEAYQIRKSSASCPSSREIDRRSGGDINENLIAETFACGLTTRVTRPKEGTYNQRGGYPCHSLF
jgi:hypothetical protein